MATTAHFPTLIYRARLPRCEALNRDLDAEIATLARIDDFGREWSAEHYANGYSSYSSHCRLHLTSPNFAELHDRLAPHVAKYVKALKWKARVRPQMTDCWANSMGYGTHHTLHLHPGSILSGVYYVNAPAGASALKLEDPRMPLFMASPPRAHYLHVKPRPGEFVLFESWLRHEVPPHLGKQQRLSVSFNYEASSR